jgi:hypothetical protein
LSFAELSFFEFAISPLCCRDPSQTRRGCATRSRHCTPRVGLHSLPGVRLVTWTIPAVNNWCLRPYAPLGLSLPGLTRLVTRTIWLSSFGALKQLLLQNERDAVPTLPAAMASTSLRFHAASAALTFFSAVSAVNGGSGGRSGSSSVDDILLVPACLCVRVRLSKRKTKTKTKYERGARVRSDRTSDGRQPSQANREFLVEKATVASRRG